MPIKKSRARKHFLPSHKEQASLEYLLTYGWAILVVLVAVMGLAYFGVLSPDNFSPSRCILPPGFNCLDFKVENDVATGNGRITIRMQNSLGEDVSVLGISAGNCGAVNTPLAMRNGESATVSIDCNTQIPGPKYSEQINLTYSNLYTNIQHTLKGDLLTRVAGAAPQINASQDISPPVRSNGAPTGQQP